MTQAGNDLYWSKQLSFSKNLSPWERQTLPPHCRMTTNLQYLNRGVVIKPVNLQYLTRGWSYDTVLEKSIENRSNLQYLTRGVVIKGPTRSI